MVGKSIKTGADKLVELVSEKKKITVDEASKTLNVGKDVVREWAEFLEEEGLVTIEYSLSKIWITEKRITKEDVISGAKEVSSEKDALARKIDVAISTLQQDTSGFEDIRKEFANIQSHIKEEIDIVKKQLSELEKYDALSKNLDKSMQKQRQEYSAFVKEAEEKIGLESQKYDELKELIEKERKNLEQYSQKITDLRRLKTDYEHTLESLKASLKNIDSVMNEYKKRFEDSNRVVENYRIALDKLDKEVSEKKGSLLTKKLQDLKMSEDRLFKNQADMEKEVKQRINMLDSHSGVTDKVRSSFDGFFAKNINTEKLISEIENDKLDLVKDLESLKSKALAFNAMANSASVKADLKELSYKLSNFDHKRASIKYKIEKLITMIKGK